MEGYPKLIAQEWPGISVPVDGAVSSEGERNNVMLL